MIKQDYDKFTTWQENSKNLSLNELRENYNEWHKKMIEITDKYGFSKTDADSTNISLFMVKTTYFFYLAMICWHSLRAYADKLREEHEKLKKTKKSKTPSKTTKKKKTTKKRPKPS